VLSHHVQVHESVWVALDLPQDSYSFSELQPESLYNRIRYIVSDSFPFRCYFYANCVTPKFSTSLPILNLTRLFCELDDFYKGFIPEWEKTQLDEGYNKRYRTRSLSPSEIITLIVFYHSSGYRTFKWFYTRHRQLSQAFPKLVSYNRFIELLPDILIPLTFFMKSRCATGNGIAFIDSTPLRVCNNLRISRHKTFKDDAERGKSSTGWFYGFKLHLLVDDCGQILSFRIKRGYVDDRKPVPNMLKNFMGKL